MIEHVSAYTKTKINNYLKVFIRLKGLNDFWFSFKSKVLQLNFLNFLQMIFKLIWLNLIKIIFAQDHMLYELSNFLIELNNIWLLMNIFLDSFPNLELWIYSYMLVLSSSKRVNCFAKDLPCNMSLCLGLFYSQNVRVYIQSNFLKWFN